LLTVRKSLIELVQLINLRQLLLYGAELGLILVQLSVLEREEFLILLLSTTFNLLLLNDSCYVVGLMILGAYV